MIELKKNNNIFSLKIRLADIENIEYMKYADMFYNYKIGSVWSAPEVLEKKNMPNELTAEMDVFSFGIVLWEIWHC